MEWPFKALLLDGYAGKVKYAQLLNDASEIKFVEKVGYGPRDEKKKDTLILSLPVRQPDVIVPVIEVFLK